MTTIDITSELKRFAMHLEHNPRTIFSAKFGDGKTYFLDKYMRQHQMDTLFIVLHPINYSVATNEDIFEYVKRDILVELSKTPDFKEVDWGEAAKTVFSFDSLLEENEFIFSDASPLMKAALVPFRLFKKVDDKYAIDKYFGRFENMHGGIFEQDQFTAAIKATIAKIQEHDRKCVLIIEDLDRIDPAHLFRILNVLGAHIDEDEGSNKFGFDNIIAVLDYYTTKHIFHHFYGEAANYDGYMAKFYCHNRFEYSVTKEARNQLYEVLLNECMMEDRDIRQYEWYQDDKFTKRETLYNRMLELSVRDIVHILDDLEGQYYQNAISIESNKIRLNDIPLLKMLAIFVRMDFRFTNDNLYQYLIRTKKCFSALGNFVCAQKEFNGAKVTFTNSEEQVIRFEVQQGGYMKAFLEYGSYNRHLVGTDMQSAMDKLLRMIYPCVHDCKPLG